MAKIGEELKGMLKGMLGRSTSHIDINKAGQLKDVGTVGGGFGGGLKGSSPVDLSNILGSSTQDNQTTESGTNQGTFATAQDKKYMCKYQVKSFIIMNGDETLDIDYTNILSIEYLNDFEYNIMALLKVSLQIDVRKKLWILKNKKDIRVKFELDKIGMGTDGESFNTSPQPVWNNEFSIYLNDEDDSFDIGSMESRISLNEGKDNQGNKIDQENYFETQNTMDIFLIDPSIMSASRYTVNKVYTEGSLQNIVAHILTESGHKKVLMSKFDNDEIYKEIIIPPMTAYKALIYLDQYYGLYKKGGLIYYDVDSLYVLNTDGKGTAFRNDEWKETTFLVSEIQHSVPGNGMILREGEQIFYPTVSEMEANSQNFAIAKNAELGSSAKLVVTDTTDVEIHNADQSFLDERNENITFIKDNNKFTGDVIKSRMEENECIFYFNGENLDISAFTPNKVFKTIFEETSKNQSNGGKVYRLAYAYHYIKPESSEYMTSSHRIILKKNGGISAMLSGLLGDILADFDINDPFGSIERIFGNIEGLVKDEVGKFEDRIYDFIEGKVNNAADKATNSANDMIKKFTDKLKGNIGNINIGGYDGSPIGGNLGDLSGMVIGGGFGGGIKKQGTEHGKTAGSYIDEKIGNKMSSSVSSIVDRFKSNILGGIRRR